MSKLHVFDHPLITHKLSIMRQSGTGSKDFRELLNEIAMLCGFSNMGTFYRSYERNFKLRKLDVE